MNDKIKTDTWWVCLNPYRDNSPKVRHETFGAAHKEAARLAELEGRKIHVLQLVGTMHPPAKPGCTWVPRRPNTEQDLELLKNHQP